MKSLNWSRVILGGFLWFLAYNVLAGAAWFAFLRRWGVPASHPLLGAAQPPPLNSILSVLLLTLTMGMFAMWVYAATYLRYSASRLTFLYVGITLWIAWGLQPNWPLSGVSLHGWNELVWELLVLIVATWVSASVYREPDGHQLPEGS